MWGSGNADDSAPGSVVGTTGSCVPTIPTVAAGTDDGSVTAALTTFSLHSLERDCLSITCGLPSGTRFPVIRSDGLGVNRKAEMTEGVGVVLKSMLVL